MTPTSVTRLLVVEDDPHDVMLLRHGLRSSTTGQLSLSWVASLADALAHLETEPVDVVLLDLGLPDSVGLDTLTAVNERWPTLSVVVLTDLTDDEVALDAVRSGAQDYVVKGSLGGPQLVRAVRQAAERGRLRAEVDRLAGRQRVLAKLGRYALQDAPLEEQLARAADLLRECLGNDLALVLHRRADGRCTVQHAGGTEGLTGELLPTLLASQLPLTGSSPCAITDLGALDAPAMAGAPAQLRDVRGAAVLPFDGIEWQGAVVLLDRAPRTYDEDTLDFLGATLTLLTEAMRRARAEHNLQERAKELSTLAAIGRIVQEPAPPREVLTAVADALVSGMQFPQEAVARVEVDGECVVSDGGPVRLAEELSADIACEGAPRGSVAVGHRDARGFLPVYEQQLVDAVAETLSLWLERHDTMVRTRESETRLRSVLEQMPGIVWTVDTELRITGHAGRGHEQLGTEPDAAVGRLLTDIDQTHDVAVTAARRALAGDPSVFEHVINGRTFETHTEPLRSAGGDIVGAISMAVDVTEAKAAQQELDVSRRRLEGLFDNAHDAFLLADDDGRYVDVNGAAARLTGHSVDELRSMGVADLAPAHDRDAATEQFRAFLAAGRAAGHWSLLRADGTVVETEFNAVADIVPGVHLSVMTDVTDRKRAEARLRRSEERFRRLAENAQDVIYRFEQTPQPHFEYVSPAIESLLGVSPDELYDDPSIPLRGLDVDDRELLVRYISGPREDATPFVARMRRPDGGELWIEERRSYVFDDDGRHAATEGVVRDVTARMQVEEALREGLRQEQAAADALRTLNEMKDTFLTAVSHELRTPLTSLKGLSHTLREHDQLLPPEQRRLLLERISANADRLQELLEDLLDIDRLTRGTIELDLAEVDVASLVTRTLEELSLDGRRVTATAEPAPAVIDRAKVERIVENLVVNAARHTGRDVPIWVHVRPEGGGVEIRVEDAGDGVPAHLQSRIFEPFETGDSAAAKVGGLGIGLNIVARFAELHGGTVGVEDREGGGASFHVWLPATPQPAAGPVAVAPMGECAERDRSSPEFVH